MCQIAGPFCEGAAVEVDHIQNTNDHSMSNLQSVCYPCHRGKTEMERMAGIAAYQRRRFRPPDEHPGSV